MTLPVPPNESPAMGRRPIAVEVFAGLGGMTLGFEQAGFDVVCAVEGNPVHARAHRFNFPMCAVLCADVATLRPSVLAEAVAEGLRRYGRRPGERIDVVFGGPPCQGFSVGGRRDPRDPRNALLDAFFDVVEALTPAAWVFENVPALASQAASSGQGTAMAAVRRRNALLGFGPVQQTVLSALDFGVPQSRRRLFCAATRDSARRLRWPHASTATGDRPAAASPTVAEAIGDLPDTDGFPVLLERDDVRLETPQAPAGRYARLLTGLERSSEDLSYRRPADRFLLTASLRTVHSAEVIRRFASTQPGRREPISRFWRLDGDAYAPTLRAGTGPDRGSFTAPRPIHPRAPRVITVREAARLHGLPDWLRPTASKAHGFRQVGNAVPPPLAAAVAQIMCEATGSRPAPGRAVELGDPRLLVPPGRAQRSR